MTINSIKDIISENKDNIAFVIGNGIHKQYKDCTIPWDGLLKSLWKEFFNEEVDISEGISLTEFFDIIEMNFYNYNKNKYEPIQLKQSAHKVKIKELQGVSSNDLVKIMLSIARKSSNTSIINNELKNIYREANSVFLASCRKWCEANIEYSTTLTNDTCIYHVLDVLSNETKSKF